MQMRMIRNNIQGSNFKLIDPDQLVPRNLPDVGGQPACGSGSPTIRRRSDGLGDDSKPDEKTGLRGWKSQSAET